MVPLNSEKMEVVNPEGKYVRSELAGSGIGGYQEFEIKCNRLCEDGDVQEVVMIYSRPWDKKEVGVPVKKFDVQVTTDPILA